MSGLPSGPVKTLTSSWGNAGALMASGAYYDWGFNKAGQVGDGSHQMATQAVHVTLPATATAVSQGGSAAGNGQTMVLLANGQLWQWGNGRFGQLGNGSTRSSPVPEQLKEPQGVRFVKVSSGGGTDYAVTSSGDRWAWGRNQDGEVGDGSSAPMTTRPVNDHITVTQVSATAGDAAAFARR